MTRKSILKPEESLTLRQVSDPQLSPDGTQVIFVVTEPDQKSKKYFRNLWMVSTEGEDARQLTFTAGRNVEPRWSPDGKRIAFVSDRPTGEEKEDGKNQIWLLPIDGGEASQRTQLEGGVHSIEWSSDGRSILFLSQETPGKEEKRLQERGGIRVMDRFIKMHQIWTVEVESSRCRQLTRDRSSKAAARFSPDGKKIAFEQRQEPTSNHTYRSSLWMMDADGRRKRKLSEGKGCDTCPRFSPDGRQIAFLHRGVPGYYHLNELAVIPTRGGKKRLLTAKLDRSTLDLRWSADGRKILFLLHDEVRQHLHAATAKGGKVRQLTEGDRVVSELALAADARRIAFVSSSPTRPGEVHVADADGSNEKALTTMNPQLQGTSLGRTRIISWKAADGLQIEGLLVLPPGYRKGKALPTIVEPHGGPAGCRTCDFYAKWQVLAGCGYAIFSPNFRGSAGYGKAFVSANEDDFGGGDFEDIMSGVDMLIEKGIADPNRLGVMGGSYGGFMTAWTIGHTDRFKGAIVGAGVTNLQSFFGTTDIQWFTRQYQRGTPWENPASYAEQSPITYVDRIKTPTLIYHGDEDRRVPIEQGEQLYVALRERRVEVEFVRYPREGHGLEEYWHQLDNLQRTIGWFARHLKGKG